ncbi:MAG: DNRLRE domain-containing protein [Chloroflexi bacterium]|nr:DNRLRE domain-containing protein [Chloroflexota bacterium]
MPGALRSAFGFWILDFGFWIEDGPQSKIQNPKSKILVVLSLLALGLLVGAAPQEESILLTAVEDAYVVADIAAPEDEQGLRERNLGSQDFIKVWYAFQTPGKDQLLSLGLLKFDLTPLKDRDVQSAHLQLFALRADLAQPARLLDVSLVEGEWSEHQVGFNKLPPVNTTPLATSAIYGANLWYSWDVTYHVTRKLRDGSVSFILGLRTLENNQEEQVVFASREAGHSAPRLVVTYLVTPPALQLPLILVGGVAAALIGTLCGLFVGGRSAARRVPAVRGLPGGASSAEAQDQGPGAGLPDAGTAADSDFVAAAGEAPRPRRRT